MEEARLKDDEILRHALEHVLQEGGAAPRMRSNDDTTLPRGHEFGRHDLRADQLFVLRIWHTRQPRAALVHDTAVQAALSKAIISCFRYSLIDCCLLLLLQFSAQIPLVLATQRSW